RTGGEGLAAFGAFLAQSVLGDGANLLSRLLADRAAIAIDLGASALAAPWHRRLGLGRVKGDAMVAVAAALVAAPLLAIAQRRAQIIRHDEARGRGRV